MLGVKFTNTEFTDELLGLISIALKKRLTIKQINYLKGEEVTWDRQEGQTLAYIIKVIINMPSGIFYVHDIHVLSDRREGHYSHHFFKSYFMEIYERLVVAKVVPNKLRGYRINTNQGAL